MPNIRYRFWNMTAPAAATHMEGTVSTKNENTSVDWFQNPSVHTSWTALANAKLPILCGCLNIWEIIVLFATAGSTEGQKENKKTQLCTVNVMTPCTVHGTSCICRWPSGMCRWWSHWTWDQKVEGSTLGSGSDLASSPLPDPSHSGHHQTDEEDESNWAKWAWLWNEKSMLPGPEKSPRLTVDSAIKSWLRVQWNASLRPS